MAKKQSLQKKAMLVSINIKTFGTVKKDQVVTGEVLKTKKATSAKAGAFSKNLLPDNFALQSINKIKGYARNWSKNKTLPWSDKGPRILPSSGFEDHKKMMTKLKADFDDEVLKLSKNWESYVAQAKIDLGDLYDVDLYPTKTGIINHFSFAPVYEQIPDASDFRVDLAVEDAIKIQQTMREREHQVLQESRKELLNRFHKTLTHMTETLDDDTKNRFHKTLTSNLAEMAKDAKGLNLTDDPGITEIAKEMAKLGKIDAQGLKKDLKKRKTTAEKGKEVLAEVQAQIDGLVF